MSSSPYGSVLAWVSLIAVGACDAFTINKGDDTDSGSTHGGGSGDDSSRWGGDSADSASDSGVDTGIDIDCNNSPDPDPIGGPDCVTQALSCGDRITATTEGGQADLDGASYQSWYCLIGTSSDYGGSERVYRFEHPGTGNVNITLTSPCADLDLIVLRWESDTCPTGDNSVLECDADQQSGGGQVTVWQNQVARYLVIVDGDAGTDAPFGLSVDCP